MRIRPLERVAFLSAMLVLPTVAGCSAPGPVANVAEANAVAVNAVAATPVFNESVLSDPTPDPVFLKTPRLCDDTALARTSCMIELILADLKANYPFIGGGGISEIREETELSYTVELPQEERADRFTYTFRVRGREVTIIGKTSSTRS
jgi:hypothetical protein